MKSKAVSVAIQSVLKIQETTPIVVGPRLHPDDPDSLMSSYNAMGDKEFFEYLVKLYDEVMDDRFGSYKVEEKENKHQEMIIVGHQDDEYDENVDFTFDKKTGVLTVGYYVDVVVGHRPATHWDPPEDITKDFYASAEFFAVKDLKRSIDKTLDQFRKKSPITDYEYSRDYTRDDYLADQADSRRSSGEDDRW
jgi:hypothetical protein